MTNLTTQVLIVGGGPVGLVLAIDLASRGIQSIVLEMRPPGAVPSPKCNHVSARSMEIFRRLGFVRRVRDAGLPADYPNDAAYRTTATGPEIARIDIPCRAERYTAQGGPDTGWPTPEPPHRINQMYLEPILFSEAFARSAIRIFNRTAFDDFTQGEDGVTAQAHDLDSGATLVITARYIIGCDGARSDVRARIGASLSGTPVIQRVQSTYIHAPDLLGRLPGKKAWMYLALNPRRCGTLVAIDGKERWLIHNHLQPEEPDFDSVDRDWAIHTILGVDADFKYDVLSQEDWVGRRLVADRFRDRRAFIAGDAAHLWMPYAGYGMNAGIADAMDLSWMLAATLNGWGGDALLDAYGAERQPITEQVSQFAMEMALKVMKHRRATPPEIEMAGPIGDETRARIGQEAYAINLPQYCCGGLNFGYFYDISPIVAYDGETPPGYTMGDFTPSTVPGCRASHLWLADGRSLYDALSPDYTLLRFDASLDVSALRAEAAARGLPLAVLDVAPCDGIGVYDRKLVLVRPDLHIAWRGDKPPADPAMLVDLLRGGPISPLSADLRPRADGADQANARGR